MPIDGIIAGLKEVIAQYNLGALDIYVKDAIEALSEVDEELDKAYTDGRYDQLCDDFEILIKEVV